MHVAILIPDTTYAQLYPSDVQARLQSLGAVQQASGNSAALAAQAPALLAQADILLAGPGTPSLQEDWLDGAPNLKLIAYSTGSVRGIIPPTIFRRGIRLVHNAPVIADAVAEFSIGLALLWLRRYHIHDQQFRSGVPWKQIQAAPGRLLAGRWAGLVGAGYVAQRHIRLLLAFGAHVRVYDPYLTPERAAELGVEKATLEQVFGESEIIAVHAPKTPETYRMINADILARIQPEAILIQNSRAWAMDQDALLRELQTGRFYAALDVFDKEPLTLDSPFFQLDNVLLTPHMAGKARSTPGKLGHALVDELERFQHGEPLQQEILAEKYEQLA
ncbi:MAG: hydroxyacid dehydrogenase [Chloroflexota bacterium]